MIEQGRRDMKNDRSRLAYAKINLKWQGNSNNEQGHVSLFLVLHVHCTAPNVNSQSTPPIVSRHHQ
jgi:hypothetical protein